MTKATLNVSVTRDQVSAVWAQHGDAAQPVPYAFVEALFEAMSAPTEEVLEAARAIGRAMAERVLAGLPAVADPVPDVSCGVYLLFDSGVVTYVGRSESIAYRLRQHRRSGRVFDAVHVIACDLERSIWLEKELIWALRPAQNLVRYERQAKASERMAGRLESP